MLPRCQGIIPSPQKYFLYIRHLHHFFGTCETGSAVDDDDWELSISLNYE